MTNATQAPIPVRFACGLYDRMLPLYTGDVKPRGIDLQFHAIDDPRVIFDRMAADQAFDACEMSSSEFISRLCSPNAAVDCPFVALPVFPSRVFRHGHISINEHSGIRSAKDLAGKRIGVPLYTMSAAVWQRGILEQDYGVDLSQVHWVQGSINKVGSHGDPTVMPLLKPANITVNQTGKTLSQLLDEGELDAIIGTGLPDARRHNPAIRRLFPDFRAVEKDYYRRTGIFPIMHLTVIRREVYEQHPQIAQSLYEAFVQAKAVALERMRYQGALRYMLPWLPDDIEEIDEVFGGDPWPYGIEANRPTLQALVNYLQQQGLIAKAPRIEDIFVPVTEPVLAAPQRIYS